MKTSNVNSGGEFITDRDETVLNTNAGTMVFGSTTGREKIHISHKSGSNINITDKVTSELATNNKQCLILGDEFATVAGNKHTSVNSDKEDRVKGDVTIITGSDNLINSTLASDWLDKYGELAAAKARPNWNYTTIGNNTGVVYNGGGTVNSESGSIQGGSFDAQDNAVPQIAETISGDLANIEREMGPGGSIRMMSGKHLYLQAGPAAVKYDSGTITPNKKEVTKCWTVQDGEQKQIKTSTSVYENTDTSNSIPFGDVHIAAGTKINMSSGSGGISITTAGEANLNSTGRTTIGGTAVSIGAGDNNNAGRVDVLADKDIFIRSSDLMTQVSCTRNDVTSGQHTFETPTAVFTGNLEIFGNLIVHGCILANGDITAGGQGGVSLLKHTHGGVCPGSDNTAAPN
jgi:phage baseplate assembly protein gpV